MNDSTSLLDDFSSFIKNNQRAIPFSFNVLDEQCGHIVENSHTNILMKLLQYKNQYGYVFLESFFSFLGLEDIKVNPNQDVRFDTERFYDKNGRIDGFIFQRDQFALIIENKVNGARNQEKQLQRYIESVTNDPKVFSSNQKGIESIWVLFMTKNGVENPDDVSLDYMTNNGIRENHFAAISYKGDVLPWLKEYIQPTVMQKDQVLNSGLFQYIDFLEGMLGMRQSDFKLLNKGKEWFINWLKENTSYDKDGFSSKNVLLDEINKKINKQLKQRSNEKVGDIADLRRNAGVLHNILESINDEPMKEFLACTRRYFEANSLMKECILSHIFNYYYIQIRDASWPRSIHFEWYPLGVNKITSKKPKLQLCLHVESPKYHGVFKSKKDLFEKKGFRLEEHNRTLSFIHTIQKDNLTPIIDMKSEDLNGFLSKAYQVIDSEMIRCIEEALIA